MVLFTRNGQDTRLCFMVQLYSKFSLTGHHNGSKLEKYAEAEKCGHRAEGSHCSQVIAEGYFLYETV